MFTLKKLHEDVCIKKIGVQVGIQTECDSEILERLSEDVRSQEMLINSQKQLFETELQEMQMKEQLSREEVIHILMIIDHSNSRLVRLTIGARVRTFQKKGDDPLKGKG